MRLKNLFGMAAMAALVLSGCSSDEVVENFSPENAIEFGTYVGRDAQSRGSVENITSVADKGFGVFAYYTNNGKYGDESNKSFVANFMNNEVVKGSIGENETSCTWTYSPIKYWPNENTDYVSFLAYAPYDANYVLDEENPTSINFTVAGTVSEQIDLLYNSSQKYNINKETQTTESKVQFVFSHALARVGFKAKLMVDNVNPDTDGTADDNNDDGKIALGNETTVAISKVELIAPFYTSGSLNLDNGEWTPVGGEEAVTYTLEGDALQNHTKITSLTTPEERINTDENFMMLIPTDKAIKVRVTYTVTTEDTKLPEDKIEVTNVIESTAFTISQTVDDETKVGLLQGKAYDLVLHIGLTSVKFEVKFVDWSEAEYEVNVPNNK